jgi:hypothetical protein
MIIALVRLPVGEGLRHRKRWLGGEGHLAGWPTRTFLQHSTTFTARPPVDVSL